jgi:hypothetical protein
MLCLTQDESVVAHWLDTTGQFSADRAKSVLDAQEVNNKVRTMLRPLPPPQPGSLQGRETALARLQVSLCFEVPQVFDVLDILPVKSEVHIGFFLALLPFAEALWFRSTSNRG